MTDEQRAQMLYEIHQEREAYDNAVGLVSIAQVLEIIDSVSDDWLEDNCDWDWHGEMKKRVKALKGEHE